MRLIGLHVRLKESLLEVTQRVEEYSATTFQCFFVNQSHTKLLPISKKVIGKFQELRKTIPSIFVHGSYWINLASLKRSGFKPLLKELEMAKRLECTHLIIHPGAAAGATMKEEGIDQIVRLLNQAMKEHSTVKIVLENTTHGNLSVGSDIHDFWIIKQKLNFPERIGFCVDTAHAYSYGYDIKDEQNRNAFITLLEQELGIDMIDLIHLNDSQKALGSRIDKHASLGEGVIGEDALRSFATHAKLQHIPLILELPLLSNAQENAMLQRVKNWHI